MTTDHLISKIASSRRPLITTLGMFALLSLAFIPELAFAADDTKTKVCGFFGGIKTILNAASMVVVTVAVIFAGYQIAFAHKRISDVTPALLGGVMIGAAAQIAKTVIGDDGAHDQCDGAGGGVALLMDAMSNMLAFV